MLKKGKPAGEGRGGRLGEGDKNGGEKFLLPRKTFSCLQTGHSMRLLYWREGGTKRGGWSIEGVAFFQPALCCHPTPVFINYAEMSFDSVRLAEELLNSQSCYRLFFKSCTTSRSTKSHTSTGPRSVPSEFRYLLRNQELHYSSPASKSVSQILPILLTE